MPRPLRALIVTDDSSFIRRLVEALARDGFVAQTEVVSDERMLLAALKHEPEVLFCDEETPGLNGLQTLQHLQRCELEIPLIVFSASSGESAAITLMRAGAADVLPRNHLEAINLPISRALSASARQAKHRQSAKELRQQLDHNRRMLDSALDAFIAIDRAGTISEWNIRAAEMFGWSRDEALGHSMAELIVPKSYRDRCLASIQRVFGQGMSKSSRQTLELNGLHRNGEEFPVEIRAWTMESAEITAIYAFIRDVRERNKLREDLRFKEGQFRQMVELATVGIGQADPRTGRMVMCNEKLCEITSYSKDELLTMRVQDLTHPDDREADWNLYQKAARGETSKYVNEKRYVRKDGTIVWVRANAGFIRNAADEAHLTVAIVEDITHRKNLESQIQQSQKMEAVGQLAGGLAHDFNNLVMVITGYSELMLSTLKKSDPMHQYVQEIHRMSLRSGELTRKLLVFSRKQVINPISVDLNTLLRELQNMLIRLIGEDIDLRLQLSPQVWPVRVDPGQIEQAIMNLVVNARDAMPRGGSLVVETANVTLGENRVTARSEIPLGDYVLIAITDSGNGIEAHVLPHIFEPFFTTKPLGHGTGLGLATVHGIIHQSHGYIEVTSQLNAGCTFQIYLPRDVERVEKCRWDDSETDVSLRGTETLLLVEDDEAVRLFLCELLQSHGYQVFSARRFRRNRGGHGKAARQD